MEFGGLRGERIAEVGVGFINVSVLKKAGHAQCRRKTTLARVSISFIHLSTIVFTDSEISHLHVEHCFSPDVWINQEHPISRF